MKRVFALLLAAAPVFLAAQNNQGSILFEEKIRLEIDTETEGMEAMQGMEEVMAKLRESASTSKKVLVFNQEQSLYTDPDNSPDNSASWSTQDGSGGEMQIEMVVMRPVNITYQDLAANKVIRQEDIFGKKFLIETTTKDQTWKLTGESETVLDFPCQKAVLQKDSNKITAWFTLQIPVSSGPQGYGKLPGMILKMDVNDGELLVEAQKIDLKPIANNLIKAPKGGKSVTEEEFLAIQEAKMKEMQEEFGGGNGQMIEIDIQR